MQNNDNGDELWLNQYEEECFDEVNANYDEANARFDHTKEQQIKNIWSYFLDTAEHITQLYKHRQYNASAHNAAAQAQATNNSWEMYTAAAGNVTKLYKESTEGMRKSNELAIQVGYQRRNKEISDFVRNKRRRYIRRDDLLSFLAGKPLPPPSAHHHHQQNHQSHTNHHHHHIHHHQHQATAAIDFGTGRLHQLRLSPRPAAVATTTERPNDQDDDDDEDDAFNDVMGAVPAGATPASQTTTNSATNNNPGNEPCGTPTHAADLHTFKEALALRSRAPDLYTFVVGEIARHCKRPASPIDVNMDSPTLSKRPRFYE